MDKYSLPTSVEIDNIDCPFDADYRNILKIFSALTDPNLLESERVAVALYLFYDTADYVQDVETAVTEMFTFLRGGEAEDSHSSNEKPLYDWDQDFDLIVAPINKIMGQDIRGIEYLHWWTFLSAFMEIGESTFSTYVGIRDKLNHSKKLEKYEEKILRTNRDKIILKKKYDTATEDFMKEIMGA